MKTNFSKIVFFILLWLMGLTISYADISATVSRTHLEKGETFELVLHLDDFDTQPDLDVLDKDFTVYNTSTNSKITTVGDRTTAQYDMVVTLVPNRSGKLTIPAIKVGRQSTRPINIEVDKALSNEEQSQYQNIFAIGTLANSESYVNVPVLYTLRLYYATPILSLQAKPFDIKRSEISSTNHKKTYQKRINGKMYEVVEESFLIIPRSTGRIRIPSVVLEAIIPNSFGQLGERKKYFSTEPKYLTVKPIPRDISIKDWFPAANVKINDNWSRDTDVKEGELLTRTVTISADGILSNDIPKLKFKSTDGFNVYAEKPTLEDIEKSGKLTGIATYKIGYMPIKQGKITTPEIKLKWFDIDNHKSKIATVATKTFEVKKGSIANTNFMTSPGSSQIVEKKIVSTFWRNIAVVFIGLWLITLILLLKCRLSKTSKAEKERKVTSDSNVYGLKDIKRNCANKNLIELQKSLISWANIQFNEKIFSLLEIADYAPELGLVLKNLNAAIYSNKEFNQYKELLNLLSQINKKKKVDKSDKLVKGLYEL